MKAALELIELSKSLGKFTLGPIDLELQPGTVNALIGPNGVGKSTMIRYIMGTVRRDRGVVKIDGNIADQGNALWKQQIGYVGDYTPLYDRWSGRKNLKALSPFYSEWSHPSAESLASKLGLDLDQVAGRYSAGERTKFALIFALARRAKLLLLDEPATGLDPLARDALMDILSQQMLDESRTVLYATHHVLEIESVADECIFLNDGAMISRHAKDDLIEDWRKLSFRIESTLADVPNEQSRQVNGDRIEIVSSNYHNSMLFLRESNATSIEEARLSLDQICVHLLKSMKRT